MHKWYRFFSCLIFTITISSASYAIKISQDTVNNIHQGLIMGVNKKCLEGGRSTITCNCLAQIVDSKLDDSILTNCGASTQVGLDLCILKYVRLAKSNLNQNSLSLCEKNPNSPIVLAGMNTTNTATPTSNLSKSKIAILITLAMLLLWLVKQAFFKKP